MLFEQIRYSRFQLCNQPHFKSQTSCKNMVHVTFFPIFPPGDLHIDFLKPPKGTREPSGRLWMYSPWRKHDLPLRQRRLDVHIVKNHLANVFPEIALAIRVLTSSIGVRVYRFFGFMLGGNRFLQCTDANTLFCVCCCFASKSRPCDVIGPKNENCGVIKHSLFYFHPVPRPRFVKGC